MQVFVFQSLKKRSQYPTMGGLGRIFRSVCVALFVFGKTTGSARSRPCLLYTFDAADEPLSVDLGGRRIMKKKNIMSNC